MQEPFRRYDRIAGAVFVALLIIGVITLSVTSPKASTRAVPTVRASAASTSRAPAPTAAAHTPKPPPPTTPAGRYPVMSLVAKLAQAAARNTST